MGWFNRDHQNGQAFAQSLIATWSKNKYSQLYHAGATRTLYNDVGGGAILLGPYQGNIPRSTAGGLVNGEEIDQENNLGQRLPGYGKRWERLHLIGVSAGHLQKRDYSNYNTIPGSHGLNTAMIPFEGVVNWVIGQKRKYIYSITVDAKPLSLEKQSNGMHIEWTDCMVAKSIIQAISYTSANDESVWINLTQKSVCPIVSAFADNEQVAHGKGIPDDWHISTINYNKINADINRVDTIITSIQNSHTALNDAWKTQKTIPLII